MMQMDVIGRVNKTNLPRGKALLPLLEAIVNSLHAIEERSEPSTGRIEVQVHRDHNQGDLPGTSGGFHPITGFVVIDNGIGFTDSHFQSFQTADSRLKSDKGGKGIGRFLWLKAFEQVRVFSTFKSDGGYQSRSFDFLLRDDPIHNYSLVRAGKKSLKTEVHLEQIKLIYQKALPRRGKTIAEHIIEHCLIYFLYDKPSEIILVDEDEDGSINLNQLFTESKPEITESSFCLRTQTFNIKYIKLRSADSRDHEIHFCANQRQVSSEKLHKYIPDLKAHLLENAAGEGVALFVSVSGDYLVLQRDFNFC